MLRPYIDWYSSKDTADIAPRGTGVRAPAFFGKGCGKLIPRQLGFIISGESARELETI